MKFLFFAGCLILSTIGILFLDNCVETAPKSIEFRGHDIDTSPPFNPWIKIPADVNGDGLPDIIVGGQKGPLVWYKSPTWEKSHIADGGYDTVDGEVCDMDKDGDQDIILGGLVWYENPGYKTSESENEWLMHRIAYHGTHDIEIADINSDGLQDVITRDQSAFSDPRGDTIFIWYYPSDTAWKHQVINCPDGEGIKVSDLDLDGDPDIIIGGIWYENLGGNSMVDWVKHGFAEFHPNATVDVADINKDGYVDVVLTPAELAKQFYKIAWYESPGHSQVDRWKEHVVTDSVECVIHSLRVADFNQDAYPDILYAEMHQGMDPDEIVLLLNRKNGEKWDKLVLGTRGSHELEIIDFDQDGDLDFFGANWSGKYQPLQLWENKMK